MLMLSLVLSLGDMAVLTLTFLEFTLELLRI